MIRHLALQDHRLLRLGTFGYLDNWACVICRRAANVSSIPDASHAGIFR